MSKIRRTQTTMERMERKASNTYGKNTTLDDLSLNRSVYEGSWENVVDDAIGFLEEPKSKKRKHRHQSQSQETSTSTHQESLAGSVEVSLVDADRGAHDNSDINDGAVHHEINQSAQDDVNTQNENALAPKSESAEGDVSIKAPELVEETVIANQEDPAVVEDNCKSNAQSKDESYSDQDELAYCDRRDHQTREVGLTQSTKSEKRKKRKSKETITEEKYDPWADDPSLPQEYYKPRRSRFRGGDEIDELVEAIDFSKRPETAARIKKKSKLSRRKTTGGAIVVHVDEEEAADPFGEVEERPFEPVKSRTSKTPIPTIEDDEPEEVSKLESDPPKRKRGRPRKQAVNEPASEAATSAVEVAKNAGKPPKLERKNMKKKEKKERNLTPPDVSAQEAEAEDEDQEYDNDNKTSTDKAEAAAATAASDTAPEIEPQNEPPPSTPSPKKPVSQPLVDKTNIASPARDPPKLQKPSEETPKEGGKGPTRHSPLSGSKVRYRVGLSRRARIEPLLRIVKK